MSSNPSIWIQSMLLLSTKAPPVVADRMRHLANQFQHSVTQISKDGFPLEYRSISSEASTSSAGKQPDTHEPFWPLTMFPSATNLVVLGNGVILQQLPAEISFVLHVVICGEGRAEFSWEIVGPHLDNQVPEQVYVSPYPKDVTWKPLANFPSISTPTSIGTCVIKAPVDITVSKEGLYFVIAKINSQELKRLPLSITVDQANR